MVYIFSMNEYQFIFYSSGKSIVSMDIDLSFLNDCVPRLALRERFHCRGILTCRWVSLSASSGIRACSSMDVKIISKNVGWIEYLQAEYGGTV